MSDPTDLKALRRKMATEEAGHIAGMVLMEHRLPSDVPQRIEAALLRYAQACLRAEASEGMLVHATLPIKSCIYAYTRMSEQRAREIES